VNEQPVNAAGTATAASTTPSVRDSALSLHEERAIELAHLLGGDYEQTIQAMAGQIMPSMRPGAHVNQLLAAVRETLPEEELNHWAADMYMSVFTADEIEHLLAFHRSPIGQRQLAHGPKIMMACAVKIQQVISERLHGALSRHGLV
jgi:hypothetical protein